MDVYIPFDGKFDADSEFEVENWFLPTHFWEKRILKKLRGRIQKIFIFLNSRVNFDSKYTHMSGNPKSHAVESLMF